MPSKRRSGKRGSYKERWAREGEEFKVELEQNIRNFEAAVVTSFSFLETEYGFQRSALERRAFEDLRDANVIIPYYGSSIAVHAYYDVCGISVGAAIYELENGQMPKRLSFYGDPGYFRAVTVDSYVTVASGGQIPRVLPEPSPRKPRIGIFKAYDMRREVLRTNMAGVVAQTAERMKTWCAPVLMGDTSKFAAVLQFHKQKYSLDV